MAASQRLRAGDLRSLYLLIGECKELGGDPIFWRRHLVEGLLRLLNAVHGACFETGLAPDAGTGAAPAASIFVDARVADAVSRNAYRELCLAGLAYLGKESAASVSPAGSPFGAFTRRQMIDDAAWYGSDYVRDYVRRTGYDDFVGARWAAAPATAFSIGVNRTQGERPFGERDLRLTRLCMADVVPLLGTRLAPAGAPSVAVLAPRLRQVLRSLLEGDAEKQIAVRLGISRHTVREYLRRLHRTFEVESRGQLLARCAPFARVLDHCDAVSPDVGRVCDGRPAQRD